MSSSPHSWLPRFFLGFSWEGNWTYIHSYSQENFAADLCVCVCSSTEPCISEKPWEQHYWSVQLACLADSSRQSVYCLGFNSSNQVQGWWNILNCTSCCILLLYQTTLSEFSADSTNLNKITSNGNLISHLYPSPIKSLQS